MEGPTGSSAACAIILYLLHGFHAQSFLLRCCRVSVLVAIPSCTVVSLREKKRGDFVFCLMPALDEAVLGPCTDLSASEMVLISVAAVKMEKSLGSPNLR